MKRLFAFWLMLLSVLCLAACAAKTIRPYDVYHPSGFEGEWLYVNMEEDTYRYKRLKAGCDEVTPKELLDTFGMETHMEGIRWEVYSVEEHPDLSCVIVVSGTNSAWTYSYDS